MVALPDAKIVSDDFSWQIIFATLGIVCGPGTDTEDQSILVARIHLNLHLLTRLRIPSIIRLLEWSAT